MNRPKEAAKFGGIPEGTSAADIPDPNDAGTFSRSKLDWDEAKTEGGRAWAEHLRHLIALRRQKIVPLLDAAGGYAGQVIDAPEKCIFINWVLGDKTLQLRANFSQGDVALPTGFGERIFPAHVANEVYLASASVQIGLR